MAFTSAGRLAALGFEDDHGEIVGWAACVDAALAGVDNPELVLEQALALADPECPNLEAVVADLLEFLDPDAAADGFAADADMAGDNPDLLVACYEALLDEVFGAVAPRPAERKLLERALLDAGTDPRQDPARWQAAVHRARRDLEALWGAHGPAEEMAEQLRAWASAGGSLDELDEVLAPFGLAGSPFIPVLVPDLGTGGLVVSLFAGIGGWDLPLAAHGFDGVGLEWDDAACRTRRNAGLATVRADVAAYPTRVFHGKVTGVVASPPCQPFSAAGRRGGLGDTRGMLAFEVLRWVAALSPDWVAVENVPASEPVWRSFATLLDTWGYQTAVHLLDAANFGVPQHRRRVFLIGHRDRIGSPEATHAAEPGLFGPQQRHVSMGDALGWAAGTKLDANAKRGAGHTARHGARAATPMERPSPALTCHLRNWRVDEPDGTRRKLGLGEALTLQGFDDSFPVHAPSDLAWERQVGNALPPGLAAAVLTAVLGTPQSQ